MAEPAAPTAAASSKKKRQRMIIIGAAGAALLLLLYLRSRSQASTTTTPNATSQADIQNAMAQQAAQDAASYGAAGGAGAGGTFADNGANAAALGDAVNQLPGQIVNALGQAGYVTTGAGSTITATSSDQPPIVGPGNAPGFVSPSSPPVGQPAGGASTIGSFSQPRPTAVPGGHWVQTAGGWQLIHYSQRQHGWVPGQNPNVLRTGSTSHSQPRRRRRR